MDSSSNVLIGGIFVLIGLGVVTYGLAKKTEIDATEYRATTCELIREAGPHYVECESDDSSDSSHDVHVRRLRHRRLVDFDLRSCGTYYCVYTMRSELTGTETFDADGDADENRCTEFPDRPGDGLRPRSDRYANFKDGAATGLSLRTKDEDNMMAMMLIIFGCIFSSFACLWILCWVRCHGATKEQSTVTVTAIRGVTVLSMGGNTEWGPADVAYDEPVSSIVSKVASTKGVSADRVTLLYGEQRLDPKTFCGAAGISHGTALCMMINEAPATITASAALHEEPTWSMFEGFISKGDDILVETITVDEAKIKAVTLPKCKGFCFRGPMTSDPVEIMFKSKWDNTAGKNQWTSYRLGTRVVSGF